MNLIPQSFIKDLKVIPKDLPVAVFMRHAKRFEIKKGDIGLDVQLTEDGKKSAYELGNKYLKNKIVDAHSSPVQRCIDTAQNLINGSCAKVIIKEDNVLSGMKIFINDLLDFTSYYLENEMLKVFDLIYEGKTVKGLNPISKITKDFINHIDNNLSKIGLNLFLSHDSFIALIAIYIFKIKITKDSWPSFMEGIFIWKENNYMNFLFRGMTKKVKL